MNLFGWDVYLIKTVIQVQCVANLNPIFKIKS